MKYAGRTIRVVAAEIQRDGCYLITQRAPRAVLPLLWEFPGGRVEIGEDDERALRREIEEKFGMVPAVGDLTLSVTHDYPQYTVQLAVYRCTLSDDEFPRAAVHDYRWVPADELDRYEFPGADQETVALLVKDL